MSLHLYTGETMPLARLGAEGFVEEIERFLVPGTPAAIAELEKAQRLDQHAQASDDRAMVAEWDAAAEAALSATLRPLHTFQSAADRQDEGEQLREPQ